ncbi:MAG TPA: hypothetical protein VK765_06925 [Solirubrobacteraceae bacterium]|nr:hypothetical protein [Solirubrobacteraceae bacterium]
MRGPITTLDRSGFRRGAGASGARRSAFTVLALTLTLSLSPSAIAGPSPADRSATDAYLQAGYAFANALVENAPASRAAVQAFAGTLGHECAGVLAGVPVEGSSRGLRPGHLQTARERGESDRRSQQMQAVRAEYNSALTDAVYGPDREASATFAQTVAPLRWSNPRIAGLIGEDVGELQELLAEPSASAVCADLRSWQQSGYRTLSAGTVAFEARQEAREQHASAGESVSSLLAPYEGASEKTLERRTKEVLERRFATALGPLARTSQRLADALGAQEEGPIGERNGSTVIGEGRTLSGGHYKLSVEPREPGDSCAVEIATQYTTAPNRRRRTSVGWGSTECASSRRGKVRASVQCDRSAGILEVQARLPPATRRVLLSLSNGHIVVSPAAIVPRRLGGPIAVYYQVLNGPTPYPLSITAVSAKGASLKTLELKPVSHCRAERTRRAAGPKFVTLTSGTTTTGVRFSVVGVLVSFGRHQHSFNLEVNVSPTGPEPNSGSSSSSSIEFFSSHSPEAAARIRDARIFTPQLSDECPPHEFAIVYGLLAKPGESVLVRTASGLTPLQLAAIPARLKAGGELAYGSFSAIPTEVIVQGQDGDTLFSESLAKQGREHAEYCQGYAGG